MTSKERMLIALRDHKPDIVPVAPDISNMIPCKLTGKPFWDIYLYDDPPWWEAYIRAVKYFGFDGWLFDVPVETESDLKARADQQTWDEAIVARTEDRIYTRRHRTVHGKQEWEGTCNVYYIADPPTIGVPPEKVGLSSSPPDRWEDVMKRTNYRGVEAFHAAMKMIGDDGVVALSVHMPGLAVWKPHSIYEYYDNRERVVERAHAEHIAIVKRTEEYLSLKPDLILIGASGHMIANPEPIFRELSLPTLKEVTSLCRQAGIPSQIHCCGPEFDLVRIAAEETDLNSINPLEEPPMGDCNLSEVKRLFGKKLSLMGNLHTTEVMLRGTVDAVKEACRRAIDAAAEGGGFILSTGDQCGRDTPFENIFAMIETARVYGKY